MSLLGLGIRIKPSFYLWQAILWIILSLFAWLVVGVSFLEAQLGGLAATLFHTIALLVHHYGHFYAAKRVGYPMRFVILWGLLGTDIYPKDEGALTGAIHRRRAIGGATANLLLSIIMLILVLVFYKQVDKSIGWVLMFGLVNTFGIFTLGAFTPLKALLNIETDGDTFLKYWGQP